MISKRWILLILATLGLGCLLVVATASAFAASGQDRSRSVREMHLEGPLTLWIDRMVEDTESNKSRSMTKREYLRSQCVDNVKPGKKTESEKTFKIQTLKAQDNRKGSMVSHLAKDKIRSKRGPINIQVIQDKLDGLVEKGCLTEGEATQKIEFIESWLGAHDDFGDRVHRKEYESRKAERIIN